MQSLVGETLAVQSVMESNVGRPGGMSGNRRFVSVVDVHAGRYNRLSTLVVAVCLLCQVEGVIGACPDTCTCNGGAVLSCAIPAGTTTLNWAGRQLTSIASGLFDGLPGLKGLHLYSNQIATLPSGIFDKLTALTALSLDSNQIATLPSGIFDKLTALTVLPLSSNQIVTLPSGIFDKLTALAVLRLYSNQIATLPSGIFDKLTALSELRLDSNQIATLPSGIFDKVTALTTLQLDSNRIAALPSGIFDKLTTLATLRLNSNQISTLPAGIFDKLTGLTYFDLGYNQIATLPSGIFDNPSRLISLSLNSNQIATLPSGIFDKLTALTELALFANQIATLPSGIFDKLTALNYLGLYSNQVATLPSGIFAKLTGLTYLYLDSNRIATLPNGIFDKLTTLATLRLNSNQISSIPAGIFDKLTALTILYLNSNQIATLPSGIFDKLIVLANLNLDPNPGNKGNLCANNAGHCVTRTCSTCFCELGWTGSNCSSICSSGTFGSDCALPCACQNGATACDRFSGVCICSVAGWTGVKCDQACASNRFGTNCTQSCTCINGAACDRFTGACGCTAGWTGTNCDTSCANDRFGVNCNSTCSCKNGAACDRFTGACTCTPGWTGPNCDMPCASGRFGANCNTTCDCKNGASCDRFMGLCNCTAGWSGAKCDQVCASDRFGANCTQSCTCKNGAACHPFSGACTCTAGWTGAACDNECLRGQYGPNCALTCACGDGSCNRFDGTCTCTPGSGFYGSSCSSCACNSGDCDDGFLGNGTCNCSALLGVGGINCNTTCDRLPGAQMYGYGCNKPCACDNGATCNPSSGECTCAFGWTGVVCNLIVRPSVPKVNATVELSEYGIGIRLRWYHDDVGPRAWNNSWRYEISRTGCFSKLYQVGDVLTFLDTDVVINQGYSYYVRAYNGRNVSAETEALAGIRDLQKTERPSPPYNVSSTPTLNPDNQQAMIKFTWKEDTSSGSIIKTFIFRDGLLVLEGPMDTEYKDRDVVFGKTYVYEIISVNHIGNSTATRFSEKASVGPSDSGTPTAGTSSSGSVAGPVAGGVVGAIVGAAGIVFAILFVRKRTSRKKMEALARSELDLIDTVVRRPEIAEIEIPGSCIHLRNRIGEGEFGEVYLADITPRGGSVAAIKAAVKTFKVTSLSSADEIRSARSAFMAEIDLMRTIPNHANIIELIGVCTQSDPNCMVLEFAAHGDLRHFLTDSKVSDFSSTDLLCFCIDIARGMDHLAKCEIVHRDLAARNCMVVAGPRAPNTIENGWKLSPKAQVIVKVADMGLSRDTAATDYYAAKTRRKLPVKWMAPESLEKRIFTHASDVWSFGIVMWEVFARGAKPYPGLENYAVSTYLSQNKRMEPPKDCPKLACAAMEACWRKHPETRPQFSQLVLQLRRGMAVLCGTEGGGGGNLGGDNVPDSVDALGRSKPFAITFPEGAYAETVGEDESLYTLQNPIFRKDNNSLSGHSSA